MKLFTMKNLAEVLSYAPRNALHMQGSKSDEHTVVTCQHPKFDTKLYVEAKGHGRTNPKLTGNPRKALKMTINTAKNVRDNLTEHYRNVELTPCSV